MPSVGFYHIAMGGDIHIVAITSPLHFPQSFMGPLYTTLSAAMKKQVKAQKLVLFPPRDKESRLEKKLNITLQLISALKVTLAAGQRALPVRSALPRGGGTRHTAPVKSGSRTRSSVRLSAPGGCPAGTWTRKTWSCRQRSRDPNRPR